MKIYLIRHGQSVANKNNEWTGQRDLPLSPEGIEEQKRLCALFTYPRAELGFSSPLRRCSDSYRLIYGRAPELLLPELMECSLGVLEGRCYTDLTNDPNYLAWLASPELPLPQGESFRGFTERVCRGFSQLLSRGRGRGITSAAGTMHGNVMRAILHHFAAPEIPHGEWKIPNGGLYKLELDDKGLCRSWSTEPEFLFE